MNVKQTWKWEDPTEYEVYFYHVNVIKPQPNIVVSRMRKRPYIHV